MNKHLLIGLAIIVGTNLIELAGVVYNRTGQPTSALTLTERELSLPYQSRSKKENSGISLYIKWRAPTPSTANYTGYNNREVTIDKAAYLALGFKHTYNNDDFWVESRELYWALEYNGPLYQAELNKAQTNYDKALDIYNHVQDKETLNKKNRAHDQLQREETQNSRLFFLEASADYAVLTRKYSTTKNTLIVKGLAKPYYDDELDIYRLYLRQLSVERIMIPTKFSSVFEQNFDDDFTPRYQVHVKWGKRFEPWISQVTTLDQHATH